MLLKTSFLENMLLKLMNQFLIISVLTVILTTISVFVFFSCYYRTAYKNEEGNRKKCQN